VVIITNNFKREELIEINNFCRS